MNIDLCFVPVKHEAVEKLPRVSGSSGKLKIAKNKKEKHWPGQVFEDNGISYEQAMDTYVAARTEETSQSKAGNHDHQC